MKRFAIADLGLGDFAGLDAAGADANALVAAAYLRLYRAQIDVPPAPADVVRVGDVVAELRAFAANLTYLCHDQLQNSIGNLYAAGKSCGRPQRNSQKASMCPPGPLRELLVYPEKPF